MTGAVGQVITFKMGKHSNGTPLLVVIGIVPDLGDFTDMHQYTSVVRPDGLTILQEGVIDRKDEVYGMGIGNTLTMPIWRIG